jgi:hypothetical protein
MFRYSHTGVAHQVPSASPSHYCTTDAVTVQTPVDDGETADVDMLTVDMWLGLAVWALCICAAYVQFDIRCFSFAVAAESVVQKVNSAYVYFLRTFV